MYFICNISNILNILFYKSYIESFIYHMKISYENYYIPSFLLGHDKVIFKSVNKYSSFLNAIYLF